MNRQGSRFQRVGIALLHHPLGFTVLVWLLLILAGLYGWGAVRTLGALG